MCSNVLAPDTKEKIEQLVDEYLEADPIKAKQLTKRVLAQLKLMAASQENRHGRS